MEQVIFSKEENIALNKDATIEMFNKNYEKNRETRLKDVNREIIDNEYWIKQNTENLRHMLQKRDELNDKKEAIEKENKTGRYVERLLKEVENIANYKTTKKIILTSDEIIVQTNTLYINEEVEEKRYLLGEMEIHMPTNVCDGIRLYNLTGTRNAYSTGMHHPHVFAEGDPCLGSFSKTITECRARDNFFGLYLTLINFCRTVDIEDDAGKYIIAWDEVDEEGNIICEGKEKGYTVCEICGRDIEEEDAYTCDECGRTICGNCFTYIGDDIICDDCLSERYTRCDICGEYHLNEEMTTDDMNLNVCDRCFEEYYAECCECESIERRENMIWDEETQEWYCKDCYNRIKAEESAEA